MKKLSLRWGIVSIVTFFAAMAFVGVSAQESGRYYQSLEIIRTGMVVSLVDGKIVPASNLLEASVLGVAAENDLEELENEAVEDGIYVVTDGEAQVLVSDENGAILQGDILGISDLSGVAGKMLESTGYEIGIALEDFSSSSTDSVLSTDTATDGSNFSIGRIAVELSIEEVAQSPSSTLRQDENKSGITTFAENVADKEVESPRLNIAILMLFLSAVLAASMVYASVRTSSALRGTGEEGNKHAMKSVAHMLFISLIILLSGVFAVYLILVI